MHPLANINTTQCWNNANLGKFIKKFAPFLWIANVPVLWTHF